MTLFRLFIIILICDDIFKCKIVSQDVLMEEYLANLCPQVDICDKNATSAVLRSNGYLTERNRTVSCCRGCSCHPDCERHMNCCYQNKSQTVLSRQETNTVCTSMGVDTSDRPEVPAYFTVSMSQVTGCVNDEQFHSTSGDMLVPTCGPQPVTGLEELMPVLSRKSKSVYKNEACARCHGVLNLEPFTSKLICDKKRGGTEKALSLNRLFEVSENDKALSYCDIVFEHPDASTILRDKRCLVDPISICITNGTTLPMRGTGYPTGMVNAECENGPFAPIVLNSFGYKNVFCALCGHPGLKQDLICSPKESERVINPEGLVFILNTEFLKLRNNRKSQTLKVPDPVACMKKQASWQEDSCRLIRCPTGMFRNRNGICVYIMISSMTNGVFILVKLEQVGGRKLKDTIEDLKYLSNRLVQNSHWPNTWNIATIYMKLRDGPMDSRTILSVGMVTDMKYINESFFSNTRLSMSKRWRTEVNGSQIEFKQTFLEYDLNYNGNHAEPTWKKHETNDKPNSNYSDLATAATWLQIQAFRTALRIRTLLKLDKMLFCEQIDLRTNEFKIVLDDFLIENKLTGRILFENEYIVSLDESGNDKIRVCLSDTPLEQRTSDRSVKLSGFSFTMLYAFLFAFSNLGSY